VSVRIRMRRMGRSHQPYFRICAIDRHAPNHGRVLEELGTYDPRVPDTDARAVLKGDRVDHWLSVGAEPTEKVAVLIKKYGTGGTRLDAQKVALERLAQPKVVPDPGEPASTSKPSKSKEAPAEEAAPEEEPAAVGAGAEAEASAEE
jgi:small subunit ribosomal protein S16